MRPEESFIGQPVRSLQTMLRLISLADPAIPTVIPDGIYGPQTMTAVSAFQRKYGIPVTGITDQYTWEQILSVAKPAKVRFGKAEPIEILIEPDAVFRAGDTGPYLYLAQTLLTQLALDAPSIIAPKHTGVLDRQTADALAAFQTLAGLEETGELDRITWQQLSRQFTLSTHHNQKKAVETILGQK